MSLHFKSRQLTAFTFALTLVVSVGACQKNKTPEVPPPDVAAVQQKASEVVEQAKAEAKKDVQSAAKIGGAGSKDVMHANAVGAFDVAMARAEGEREVAKEKCKTLASADQSPCTDQAESAYQTAVATAKAARESKTH